MKPDLNSASWRRRFAAESSRAACAWRNCSATVATSGGAFAGLQILQPGFGRLQLLLGLAPRRDLVFVFEREQRRAGRDLRAALHGKLCSVPANGAATRTYSPST